MTHTARFWTRVHGSPVRIALRDGDTVEHGESSLHEEGWSSEAVTWERVGDVVYQTTDTDGRDCDGRMSTHDVAQCHVSKLADYQPAQQPSRLDAKLRGLDLLENYPEGPRVPMWERVTSRQRDYSAEAMDY